MIYLGTQWFLIMKLMSGRKYKMNEVIKILPMTTLLSDMLELSRLGWCIVGFKNDMVVLKFKQEVKE